MSASSQGTSAAAGSDRSCHWLSTSEVAESLDVPAVTSRSKASSGSKGLSCIYSSNDREVLHVNELPNLGAESMKEVITGGSDARYRTLTGKRTVYLSEGQLHDAHVVADEETVLHLIIVDMGIDRPEARTEELARTIADR